MVLEVAARTERVLILGDLFEPAVDVLRLTSCWRVATDSGGQRGAIGRIPKREVGLEGVDAPFNAVNDAFASPKPAITYTGVPVTNPVARRTTSGASLPALPRKGLTSAMGKHERQATRSTGRVDQIENEPR